MGWKTDSNKEIARILNQEWTLEIMLPDPFILYQEILDQGVNYIKSQL